MSFLSEAHDQFHAMYGKYATCNLDCGASETVESFFEADAERLREVLAAGGHGIRCGRCKLHHANVSAVRFCYEVKWDAQTFERNEAAMEKALAEAGDCEHGLNAALCAGPDHYPSDVR